MGAVLAQQLAASGLARALILVSPAPRAGILPSSEQYVAMFLPPLPVAFRIAMLAREVWRELQRSTPLNNVIDVHIARLRRKIDEGAAVRLIHTVRGVGFILREGALEQ